MPTSTPRRRRSVTQRLMAVVDSATSRQRETEQIRKRAMYPIYVLRVALQVVRRWIRDRTPQQAASLAYKTALSLVPATSVALMLLRVVAPEEVRRNFVQIVSREMFPVSHEAIGEQLLIWSDNINFANTGLPGLVFTIILAFALYSNVEQAMNHVWRVPRGRQLAQRFFVFYGLVTILPALMAVSLFQATGLGITSGPLGAVMALLSIWAALFVVNKFLPAIPVKWIPAAVGALVSAILFEFTKAFFRYYVTHIVGDGYVGIYGALWLLPVALIWIYVSWLIVLLGVEVTHAMNNLEALEKLDRRQRIENDVEILEMVNGVVATRFMCAIVAHWQRGELATRRHLAEHFDVSVDVVNRLVDRLKESRLLSEVENQSLTGSEGEGLVPIRNPRDIALSDVLGLFRGSDVISESRSLGTPRLDEVLANIEQAVRTHSKAISIGELAAADEYGSFEPETAPAS